MDAAPRGSSGAMGRVADIGLMGDEKENRGSQCCWFFREG
jgi:hypothetical protein